MENLKKHTEKHKEKQTEKQTVAGLFITLCLFASCAQEKTGAPFERGKSADSTQTRDENHAKNRPINPLVPGQSQKINQEELFPTFQNKIANTYDYLNEFEELYNQSFQEQPQAGVQTPGATFDQHFERINGDLIKTIEQESQENEIHKRWLPFVAGIDLLRNGQLNVLFHSNNENLLSLAVQPTFECKDPTSSNESSRSESSGNEPSGNKPSGTEVKAPEKMVTSPKLDEAKKKAKSNKCSLGIYSIKIARGPLNQFKSSNNKLKTVNTPPMDLTKDLEFKVIWTQQKAKIQTDDLAKLLKNGAFNASGRGGGLSDLIRLFSNTEKMPLQKVTPFNAEQFKKNQKNGGFKRFDQKVLTESNRDSISQSQDNGIITELLIQTFEIPHGATLQTVIFLRSNSSSFSFKGPLMKDNQVAVKYYPDASFLTSFPNLKTLVMIQREKNTQSFIFSEMVEINIARSEDILYTLINK